VLIKGLANNENTKYSIGAFQEFSGFPSHDVVNNCGIGQSDVYVVYSFESKCQTSLCSNMEYELIISFIN
jgi:hypothetical protein